jgi:threonine aldolase
MARYDFASDNTAPIAPEALAAILTANQGFMPSYGEDPISARAADLIRGFLDADAEVRFVASGTAANALGVAALCRPFESVLAHAHAHLATDETGAPAYFGQGLGMIGLEGASGRIDPAHLARVMAEPDSPHRQSPAVLSLTQATEYGAVYSEPVLAELITAAKAGGCKVHMDGARLANAVATGFDPSTIAPLQVDLLVFGGAKAGMPATEALVIFDKSLARRLDSRLKQAGQLPSKGRFYAAPFLGMLEDGALVRRAAHANAMARRLADACPFPVRHPVEANGVFVEMDEPSLDRLQAAGWRAYRVLDGSVRFMCSWATTPDAVDELASSLAALS